MCAFHVHSELSFVQVAASTYLSSECKFYRWLVPQYSVNCELHIDAIQSTLQSALELRVQIPLLAWALCIVNSTWWGVDHTAFEVQISWLACATNAITSSNYSCSDAKTSVKCPFRFSLKTLWNKNCPNEVPPVQSFIIPTFDMSKGKTSPMVKDSFHNFVVH